MSEPAKMTRREEQAYNDGRMAFRNGLDYHNNPRRSPAQRASWNRGFEHERRLDLAEKATPEERAEATEVAGKLGAWARQQRGAKQ